MSLFPKTYAKKVAGLASKQRLLSMTGDPIKNATIRVGGRRGGYATRYERMTRKIAKQIPGLRQSRIKKRLY